MTSSLRLYPNWSWVRTNQNARIIWIIIYLFCTVILIYGSVVKNIISVTMLMEGFPEILGSIVRTVKLLGHPLEFPCRDFRDRAILVLSWLLMQMLGDSAIYKGTQSLFKVWKNSNYTWFSKHQKFLSLEQKIKLLSFNVRVIWLWQTSRSSFIISLVQLNFVLEFI